MFGYQFLNGCNPVLISKCTKLPDKFPVTHEMVSVSLERELTLEEEIKVFFFYFQFLISGNNLNSFPISKKQLLKLGFILIWRTTVVFDHLSDVFVYGFQAGNIYIVDFEVLEGISPNCTDPSTTQYLAAPICLLYKNVRNKVLPIAIQVQFY